MNNERVPSLDEIIFEKRNKEYGAYVLRQVYTDNMMKGVVAMAFLVSVFLVLTAFVKSSPAPLETGKRKKGDDVTSLLTDVTVMPDRKQEVVKKVSRDQIPTRVVKTEVIESPEPPKDDHVESGVGSENGSETGVDFGASEGTPGGIGTDGDAAAPPPAPEVFIVAEEMPYFEGGMSELHRYLQRKMRYPSSARRLEIEGTVYVSFVIGSNGTIRDVQIVKGIYKDCDQEAKRVIESMPKWVPGRQQKVPVAVRMVLPIKFALAKS